MAAPLNVVDKPDLKGVRAKINRAKHHFEQIDTAVRHLFINADTTTAAPYYNMDRQELVLAWEKTTPVDPTLPLLAGDCIHNARSALDHLVFQLAVLNHAPREAAKKTSFPVYLTPAEFKNAVRGKIAPFISGNALAEIEKLQPYAAANAGADDIIWVLSQLDIIDKHRLLIVTASKFRPTAFTVTAPSGHEFSTEIPSGPWKPSERGTEVLRFDLSKAVTQPGKVNVKVNAARTVQIEKTGLICDGMILQAVLHDSILFVENIVGSFGRLFFSE